MRGRLALVALVASGALVGCGGAGGPAAGSPVAPAPGSDPSTGATARVTLPDRTLPRLGAEGSVRLSDLRGPLVVNVWASWCPPCRAELPALAEVAAQADGRVAFLGVDVLDDPAAAAAVARDLGVGYPSVFDEEGLTRGELRWTGPPATYLVDASGEVVHVRVGEIADAAELRDLIGTHLGVEVAR